MKRILHTIATGCYIGYLPWAPGTWGTILIGIPLYLLVQSLGDLGYGIVLALLIVLSICAAHVEETQQGEEDPHIVVIDEVVGYLFAMLLVPFTITNVVLSCGLFRLFDIIKPYPIGFLDRNVKGGLGITLDDIAAGLLANISLRFLNWML